MHSYLFSGFPLPQALSKIIDLIGLSLKPEDLDAHPDIIWIRPEVNTKTRTQKASIKIETIRQLPNQLNKKPFELHKQLCIMVDAQTMSLASQNALLKILEEPGEDVLFFLLSHNHQLLLSTIQSRCQVFIAETLEPRTDEELETTWQEIVKLQTHTLGQKLTYISSYSKDRASAETWLQTMIAAARWRLLSGKNTESCNLITLLKNLSVLQKDLQANVNSKLVLDQAMIVWDKPQLDL